MAAKTFQCPSCGSPLNTTGGEKEIQCAYCRSMVIVPEELREARQSPPAQPFTEVLLKDDFSDPSSGWEYDRHWHYTEEYKNGHYHILIKSTYNQARVMSLGYYTNFSAEVDVQKVSGGNEGTIGVVCRQIGKGYYSFEFDHLGHSGIFESDSNGTCRQIARAHFDPNTLNPNGINHIKGICDHQNLTLILNNQVLAQTQNSTHTEGAAGFTVNPGRPGNAMDVLFSNFTVKGS